MDFTGPKLTGSLPVLGFASKALVFFFQSLKAPAHRVENLGELRLAVTWRNVLLAIPVERFHMYEYGSFGRSLLIVHPQRCDQLFGFGIAFMNCRAPQNL